MRGSVKSRYEGSWSIVLDLGHETDPKTGKKTRRQKWVTFHSTPGLSKKDQKKEAEAKLAELLNDANKGTFISPSTVTLIDYLRAWVDKSIKPPMRSPETYRVYTSIIEQHIAPSSIAHIPLQQLRSADLERYLADQTKAAPTTLKVHHAVLHKALKRAVKDHVVTMNAAAGNEYRAVPKDHAQANARTACWSATEARAFIDVAKKESPQLAAFLFLALDTGARKSELAGLWWTDLDLDTATLTMARQLDKAGEQPVYGPTKMGKSRTVTLGSETIAALRLHKKTQATLKMQHRTSYADFGLIFAKEEEHTHGPNAALGQPIKTLSEERFQRVVTLAGLPPIKFHSTRHTSITLALNAGVPVHVVASRVGHAKATMTLDVYTHALPDAQQEAAAKLRKILHG